MRALSREATRGDVRIRHEDRPRGATDDDAGQAGQQNGIDSDGHGSSWFVRSGSLERRFRIRETRAALTCDRMAVGEFHFRETERMLANATFLGGRRAPPVPYLACTLK